MCNAYNLMHIGEIDNWKTKFKCGI
jgi:hypothetical protein